MSLTQDEKLAVFYMRALRGVQSLSSARVGNAASLLSAIEKYVTDMLAEPEASAVSKVVADIESLESAKGWARTLIEALEPIADIKTESKDPTEPDPEPVI